MSWLTRLKNADNPETDATKTTKRVSVVSVASIPADPRRNAPDTRSRLLSLAEAEGLPHELVHKLPAADLHECEGLTDAQLSAYLSILDTGATMRAGTVPDGYTERAICQHCGPVWLWPGAGEVGTDGWARVLGCPWCHKEHRPEHMDIPRPMIRCRDCRHFEPETINPPGGMGTCVCEGRGRYPFERHQCKDFRPCKSADSSPSVHCVRNQLVYSDALGTSGELQG